MQFCRQGQTRATCLSQSAALRHNNVCCSNGLAGQAYVAGSLGELLGNVSVLMLQKGQRQMDEGLASILSGSTST